MIENEYKLPVALEIFSARKELYSDIKQMYKLHDPDSEVLDIMLSRMGKREMKLLCKIVRVANRVILYE